MHNRYHCHHVSTEGCFCWWVLFCALFPLDCSKIAFFHRFEFLVVYEILKLYIDLRWMDFGMGTILRYGGMCVFFVCSFFLCWNSYTLLTKYILDFFPTNDLGFVWQNFTAVEVELKAISYSCHRVGAAGIGAPAGYSGKQVDITATWDGLLRCLIEAVVKSAQLSWMVVLYFFFVFLFGLL